MESESLLKSPLRRELRANVDTNIAYEFEFYNVSKTNSNENIIVAFRLPCKSVMEK